MVVVGEYVMSRPANSWKAMPAIVRRAGRAPAARRKGGDCSARCSCDRVTLAQKQDEKAWKMRQSNLRTGAARHRRHVAAPRRAKPWHKHRRACVGFYLGSLVTFACR